MTFFIVLLLSIKYVVAGLVHLIFFSCFCFCININEKMKKMKNKECNWECNIFFVGLMFSFVRLATATTGAATTGAATTGAAT